MKANHSQIDILVFSTHLSNNCFPRNLDHPIERFGLGDSVVYMSQTNYNQKVNSIVYLKYVEVRLNRVTLF
jgi:hypothetical protein